MTTNGVLIANGPFTVTIDFGSAVWNGATNWLQIGVESSTNFMTLAPRQQLIPVPYAISAEGLNGTIQASQMISIGNSDCGAENSCGLLAQCHDERLLEHGQRLPGA